MIDKTQFTFSAQRWLQSETVLRMSDAERGQFINLLAHSWVIDKECTLPDDPDLLAYYARCLKVSERVLDCFPVVQTACGTRRRNKALYENCWLKLVESLRKASEDGKKGASARYDRVAIGTPSENHGVAIANRTEQNTTEQTEQNTTEHTSNQGDYRNLRTHAARAFGRKPQHWYEDEQAYLRACEKYGEQAVLDQFDEWANQNSWMKDKIRSGEMKGPALRKFFQIFEENLEIDRTLAAEAIVSAAAEAESKKLIDEIEDKIAKRRDAEHKRIMDEVKKEREALAEQQANPDGLF